MPSPPAPGALASWIELSARAYEGNVRAFRAVAGPARRVGAVLKGNAYGHGFYETLARAHPRLDVLYVITPGEALAIRAWEVERGQPRREVLVVGAASPDECVALARSGVTVVAGDSEMVRAAAVLRAAGE